MRANVVCVRLSFLFVVFLIVELQPVTADSLDSAGRLLTLAEADQGGQQECEQHESHSMPSSHSSASGSQSSLVRFLGPNIGPNIPAKTIPITAQILRIHTSLPLPRAKNIQHFAE